MFPGINEMPTDIVFELLRQRIEFFTRSGDKLVDKIKAKQALGIHDSEMLDMAALLTELIDLECKARRMYYGYQLTTAYTGLFWKP